MNETSAKLKYVGFWIRVAASLIDTALLALALWPLGRGLYRNVNARSVDWDPNALGGMDLSALEMHWSGSDWLLNLVLPAVVVIVFWMARQATPGKMVFGARVVDASTGRPMRLGQALLRYVGYYISTLFFFLGFIWVGIDRRKQGWHDKLAHTVVVRRCRNPATPAAF